MQRKPMPNESNKSRILLVDDHPIVREGLGARIDQEPDLVVCALAAEAHEAMDLIPETRPDLVIADLSLGGKPGLELVKDLDSHYPSLPVLVLSLHDETLWAERVLRAGAKGYISKSQATQKVVDAIHHVLDGGIWVSDKINDLLLKKYAKNQMPAPGTPLERLSDRELEIFQMIGQGLTVREIAGRLFLSHKTVEVHRDHIRDKLGLKSSAELLRYAVTYTLEG